MSKAILGSVPFRRDYRKVNCFKSLRLMGYTLVYALMQQNILCRIVLSTAGFIFLVPLVEPLAWRAAPRHAAYLWIGYVLQRCVRGAAIDMTDLMPDPSLLTNDKLSAVGFHKNARGTSASIGPALVRD